MARGFKKHLITLFLLMTVVGGGWFGYLYWRVHRYDQLIAQVAGTYKIETRLVRAVIYEESYFDPSARSGAGAVGLMQITPIVISEWEQENGASGRPRNFAKAWARKVPGVPYEKAVGMSPDALLTYPEINLNIGCWYLSRLWTRYADEQHPLAMALAGYNAGPSQAERWRGARRSADRMSEDDFIRRIDYPETQNYVRRIIHRYKKKPGMFDFLTNASRPAFDARHFDRNPYGTQKNQSLAGMSPIAPAQRVSRRD